MTAETVSDLRIPAAAAEEWFHCGCEAGCDRAGFQAAALPIVVAAELRAQAAYLGRVIEKRGNGRTVQTANKAFALMARILHDRADELDPPAGTAETRGV